MCCLNVLSIEKKIESSIIQNISQISLLFMPGAAVVHFEVRIGEVLPSF